MPQDDRDPRQLVLLRAANIDRKQADLQDDQSVGMRVPTPDNPEQLLRRNIQKPALRFGRLGDPLASVKTNRKIF